MAMDGTEKKARLLKGAVLSVAQYGLENTTIRTIGKFAGINEAYTYRYFDSKDHLLAQAYIAENGKLMKLLLRAIEHENRLIDSRSLEERSAYVIREAWKYLVDSPDICRFLVYYYHSPSFVKYAMEDHAKWIDRLAELLHPVIPDRDEAVTLLYTVFDLIYGFAVQVADGRLPDTVETEGRVFGSTYTVISARCGKTKTQE